MVMQNNKCLNRPWAWVRRGQRSRCKTIFVRGLRLTALVAISCEGIIALRIFEGASDKDTFSDFFNNDIVSLTNTPVAYALAGNTCSLLHKCQAKIKTQSYVQGTHASDDQPCESCVDRHTHTPRI